MKLVRIAGVTAVALCLAALVFVPGPPAAGQSTGKRAEPQLPRTAADVFSNQNGSDFYALHIQQGPGQDPEMQKLLAEEGKSQREAVGLVAEYTRKEKDSEREAVKTKLADVLGKQFDAQQKRRDLELTRLEAQVKKLREVMKKRGDARQNIVNNRLDQLIREADGLGWAAPPGIVPQSNFYPNVGPAALR
jgi:hypothetical protein